MTLLSRVAALVALAVLPALLLQLHGFLRIDALERSMVEEEAMRLLEHVRGDVVAVVEGADRMLALLSEASEVRSGPGPACDALFARLPGRLPASHNLHVTDTSGTIICSSHPQAVGMGIADRAHVQAAPAGRPFAVGNSIVRRTTGQTALTFAAPYYRLDGVLGGAVAITMDVSGLQGALGHPRLPEGASVRLTDSRGRSLVVPPGAPELGAAMTADWQGVTIATGSDGANTVVARAAVDSGVPLTLTLALDGSVLDSLRGGQWRDMAVLALALVLSLAVAVLAYRQLVARPLLALEAASRRWGRGDYFARVPKDGPPELRRLGRFLNEAAEAIQARAVAEAKVRRQKELLSLVLDHLPVGVWVTDETGRIIQSNPAGPRIWAGARYVGPEHFGEYKGWRRDTGRPVAPEEWAAARAIRKGEASINEEIDIECFDGTRKTILNSAVPLRDEHGGIRGAIIVNEDITARVRIEEHLRSAKAAADSANTAKSRFLAIASHDLRQPLQSLLLLIAALGQRLEGDERVGVLLSRVQETLEGLATLLTELLEVSRLESGAVRPRTQAVPLAPLLRRLAGEYEMRAAEKGLELRVVPCDLTVVSDPVLLKRILRNLVENGLRYTESGRILVGCRREGDSVRIEVHDTGPGIPDKEREAIFHEFHQLEPFGAAGSQGLGLGLSIVDRLSQLLGHRISLASEVGRGSCFAVTMRLADAEVVPQAVGEC